MMNKQEYLSKLAHALREYDPEIQEEIMHDYAEHFQIGAEDGKSDAEIIASLGDIQELIETLGEPDAAAPSKQASKSSVNSQKPVKKVVLDAYIADVEVLASRDNTIQADYLNDGSYKEKMMFLFHGEQVGDVYYLKLEQANKNLFGWHSFTSSDMKIKLAIPNGLSSLQIKSISGDTEIDSIQIESLQWNSASGDLSCTNSAIKDASFTNASGDICCTGIQGNVRISTASGDISIKGHRDGTIHAGSVSGEVEYQGNSKDIHANSTSGDIELVLEQDANIQLNTVSGDCEISLPIRSSGLSMQFKSLSGEFYSRHRSFDIRGHRISYQSETKGSTLSISTVSGDATLRER